MIFWMTMSDLGPRTLPVYTVLSASSISSRMAGARFLARLVVNRSLWGDSACNVQGNVTQSYVCGASVSDALGCIEVQRRLLLPGRGCNSKAHKTGLGCNGLGLLPLWLFALCQFASSPSMCFDSGFSSLSIHGLRLQDVVDLMQCLLSGRFLGNHSFSCVLVC